MNMASVSGILHLGGTRRMKTVPLDNDIIESARGIGISFGD